MAMSQRLRNSLYWPGLMVVVLWVIQLVNVLLGGMLGRLGVFPRDPEGLIGIVTSPLIHGDWGHLMSNTPPLFVLAALLFFFYPRVATTSFFMIYLLTGVTLWLFGRPVYHIGASGVIYGLVAFIAWNGLFRRNLKAIALALVVVFYYGGMFLGILPGQPGISWEGHLFGALAGIFTAYYFKDEIETDEERKPASWELEDPQPEEPFLDPHTFSKNKKERERDALNEKVRRYWE